MVDFGAMMRQGDEGWVELLDDTINAGVARHGPAVLGGDRRDLPMNRRRAGRWALQRQAFDEPLLRDPALGGAQRDPVFLRHVRERHPILQRGPQLLIAFERLRPVRFGHNGGRPAGATHKPST